MTADGRVVRYGLPIRSDVFDSVWGLDDALWLKDDGTGGFTRMTADGHFTRYRYVWATRKALSTTLPPTSVIAGPDGTVWFGDRQHHRVMAVAPDGSRRVIARLADGAQPQLLATGLNGAVWFADIARGGLGRILPDGRVDAMRYRTNWIPSGTIAPNGDLWFIRLTVRPRFGDAIVRTDVVRIDPGEQSISRAVSASTVADRSAMATCVDRSPIAAPTTTPSLSVSPK